MSDVTQAKNQNSLGNESPIPPSWNIPLPPPPSPPPIPYTWQGASRGFKVLLELKEAPRGLLEVLKQKFLEHGNLLFESIVHNLLC